MGLIRRTPLKRGTARLERRTPLARGDSQLKRTPMRRPRPRQVLAVERALGESFRAEALRQGRCSCCGYRGPHLEAHHAIPRSVLERLIPGGAPAGVKHDPRNGLALCSEPAHNRCHDRWHLRITTVTAPERVREFARELDQRFGRDGADPFTAWLDANYARDEGVA